MRIPRLLFLLVIGSSLLYPGSTALAQGTARVSMNSLGQEGDEGGLFPRLSHDGRYVAFESKSKNLVDADHHNRRQIFLRDTHTGTTVCVSVNALGELGNGKSTDATVSADGRYVVFQSRANNLVPGDTNGVEDIFVHDVLTRQTNRVNISSSGAQANFPAFWPTISADGGTVCFSSVAPNLVPSDTNFRSDIFIHDLRTGQTERVSINSLGMEANGDSHVPSISGDGQRVVFSSQATNLVPNQSGAYQALFLHDRSTRITSMINVTSGGVEGSGNSASPVISADGSTIAFESTARNLVPGLYWRSGVQILVLDIASQQFTLVSKNSSGDTGTHDAAYPSLSADGQVVSFVSKAINLDPRAFRDHQSQAYLHHRPSGTTSLVSESSTGFVSEYFGPDKSHISGNGQWISFSSSAKELSPRDGNDSPDAYIHRPLGPILYQKGSPQALLQLRSTGGIPNRPTALLIGRAGNFVQSNSPCVGLQLDLSNPRLVKVKQTNLEGEATFFLQLPAGAQGFLAQAVDLNRCKTTNWLKL